MRLEDTHATSTKELVHIYAIPTQEVHRHRVVMLDRLADVNHMHTGFVPQQVVLGEVCVHKTAVLKKLPHDAHNLQISVCRIR